MKLLATTAELSEGSFETKTLDGLEIIVGKADGRYFAIQDLCPHAYVNISYGYMEGCQITCPWHGFTYDVHSGECVSWEGTDGLNRFPVEVKGGDIFLLERED